jgi:hypothetical protein
MAHGCVPIGDGAVEKAAALRHAKSRRVIPVSPDKYEQVRKENVQLKENNEMLLEENSVHCEVLMVITFLLLVCVSLLNACMHLYVNDFQLQNMFEQTGTQPPPELLQRLANIDTRRHQVMYIELLFDNLSIVLGGCLSRQ